MDEFSKGSYDMILGQDLLIELGLNLKWSKHVIEAHADTFKVSTIPMVDLVKFVFKYLNTGEITLKNVLPMITPNKYTSQNMYVMLQNDYM